MRANVIRERDKDRGTRRAPRRKEATAYVAASVLLFSYFSWNYFDKFA